MVYAVEQSSRIYHTHKYSLNEGEYLIPPKHFTTMSSNSDAENRNSIISDTASNWSKSEDRPHPHPLQSNPPGWTKPNLPRAGSSREVIKYGDGKKEEK